MDYYIWNANVQKFPIITRYIIIKVVPHSTRPRDSKDREMGTRYLIVFSVPDSRYLSIARDGTVSHIFLNVFKLLFAIIHISFCIPLCFNDFTNVSNTLDFINLPVL